MPPSHGDLSRLVGELLVDRMKSRGLSQIQIAAQVGLSQPTLSRCLTGNRRWNLDQLAAVCVLLGTRASDVLAVAEDTLAED